MRHSIEDQLQISQFIKDPASLKLLILAGTSIRSNQLSTVNKCTSLIKLDLSSNQLMQLPLKCQNFPHLRILYLHDNKLSSVNIIKTNLEYISLFDNVIKDYRTSLIQSNDRLMAIDCNVITASQRLFNTTPQPYSLLKWPIVQISQSLQHEEDYLNLLKAQLFVIHQVHKKTKYVDVLNKYFMAFNEFLSFKTVRNTATIQNFFHKQSVKEVTDHWINFTKQKLKLRRLLENTSKSYLLLNKMERAKHSRSPGVTQVLNRYLKSVRERMVARKILEPSIAKYRLLITSRQQVISNLVNSQKKLYLKQSQLHYFQKIILYAKKILFSRKEYDLLDNFEKIVYRSSTSYHILRSKSKNYDSFLLNMVANSMRFVLIRKDVDKRSVLYNRKGHKGIQIKRVVSSKLKIDRQKLKALDSKVQNMYKRYDTLVEYVFLNEIVFEKLLLIIRYFNTGNSQTILKNQAAYFQTEVIFQDKKQSKIKPKLFVCCFDQMKRVISANVIQRWWRRISSIKKLNRNIIKEIKTARATNLINKWLRNLTFRHRLQFNKLQSCIKSTFRQIQLFIQLEIYMHLPEPRDTLKLRQTSVKSLSNQYLYNLIHYKTQTQIIQYNGRSWLKIKYLTAQDAYEAQRELSLFTYKYYFNGNFIRMFSQFQINYVKDLSKYQNQISKIYKIKIDPIVQHRSSSQTIAKKIEIENNQPCFIWPLLEEGFANMFKAEDIQSMPISIFIYNKTRRPLKVNCDLLWVSPSTIYYYRKRIKPQIKIITPKKQKVNVEPGQQQYLLPHIRHKLNRQRQFSVKQHKSLLRANRQRGISHYAQLSLLSETLNIKKS